MYEVRSYYPAVGAWKFSTLRFVSSMLQASSTSFNKPCGPPLLSLAVDLEAFKARRSAIVSPSLPGTLEIT